MLLLLSILYMYFLWRTQGFLDRLEEGGVGRIDSLLLATKHALLKDDGTATTQDTLGVLFNENSSTHGDSSIDRFLIFVPIGSGQGTGNIIAGLLSVHLMALEFGRIVCIDPTYETFLKAFEPVHPVILEKCPPLLQQGSSTSSNDPPKRSYQNTLRVVNFEQAPNECELKTRLASDTPILYMVTNTYPRWPAIPDNFFFTYYKAKPALLSTLPYDTKPSTVVHLRQADGAQDARKGLDEKSLQALGKMLPADTYLVTNRVEWYDKFELEFGWHHPEWNEVVHSAMQRSWGTRGGGNNNTTIINNNGSSSHMTTKVDKDQQELQMWCDWYTILTADIVYHTHSDFSISAIHFQNLESRTIIGWNESTGILELEPESWRMTGETERLVDRTVGGKGTSDLRVCNRESEQLGQAAEQLIHRRKQQ